MSIIDEAEFVDMDDGEVKDAVGALYERIKRIDETMKLDETAIKMREDLNEYLDDNYRTEIKLCKLQLKAMRSQAEVRGIKFSLPGED